MEQEGVQDRPTSECGWALALFSLIQTKLTRGAIWSCDVFAVKRQCQLSLADIHNKRILTHTYRCSHSTPGCFTNTAPGMYSGITGVSHLDRGLLSETALSNILF
jgi:hypothetical protein